MITQRMLDKSEGRQKGRQGFFEFPLKGGHLKLAIDVELVF